MRRYKVYHLIAVRVHIIVAITILSVLVGCGQLESSQTPKYLDTTLDFETRALDLVQQMTLAEKISQLGNSSDAIPRLGILEYDWWNECLHGVARAGTATVFPQAIGMAATFDTGMMRQVAEVISDEARAKYHEAQRNNDYGKYKGLTFWSPNINIFRDPRWGRGQETYGEDPYLTGQMGIQFVKGLQGDDSKYLKVIATAKHFAVHNGPESNRHSFNAVPTTRDLWETYLPAFKDLVVDAKVESVMSAYNRIDGQPASASQLLLKNILRKQWGFNGYVVSDCGAIKHIYQSHKVVNSLEEAAAIGIDKGCDLNCGKTYKNVLKNSVEQGLIREEEINKSVYRLMLARMKLGMFDPVEKVPYAQIPFNINNSSAHNEMALKMAQKSMTLLKNDEILPLHKRKIKHIAVIGPNTNSIEALRGNYFGEASNPIPVLDGIKKLVENKVKITYANEVPLVSERDNDSSKALSNKSLTDIRNADVAIFVGGLDANWEGEEMRKLTDYDGFYKGDRTKIELPKVQIEALKAIEETGTPVVLVLLGGSAIALEGLEKDLDAILMGWYPGQRGGDAVASVLFGTYNPAGRLPVTFYSSTKELPDFNDYNMTAGNGFTYRYYKGKPLYPFGHGLSYTKFQYSDIKINKNSLDKEDEITVTLKVKNIGKLDGEEVVQLYVKDIKSDTLMAIKQLRKFERISLKKGQAQTIEFKLDVSEDFRYYNSTSQDYKVEPGAFEIQIGSSSEDIRLTTLITVEE